ncbi:MAG: ABC transporter substrate-binding protein [Chitinophagaceae bacterium]|nr:ABC transporter substrate-binding protein [Chitinophagaceae bacterium]
MKKIISSISLCTLLCIGFLSKGLAQTTPTNSPTQFKVALIAPLYLDSLFSGNNYRYGKKFPRFVVPGIEFIQGAMVALDSMPNPAQPVEVSVFDCGSDAQSVDSLILTKKLNQYQLIIGAVRDQDYLQLAHFSGNTQIPFISVSYPNDGGIQSNPFLVILNSTLRAHCEAIFGYILQNHESANILLCRQPGSQEDRVQGYFNEINQPDGAPLLHLKSLRIADSNFNQIKSRLDSTKQNIVIAGSLDEYFASGLASACNAISKTYRITLIGMPNWEGFKSLQKNNALKGFPIYFTSPYYNPRTNNLSNSLKELYLAKYKGYPTDFSYKGFEAAYLFIPLLLKHPYDFTSHLNDFQQKVFSDFIFKPVINSHTGLPDYFENKHLYFLQILNGVISKAW